MSWWTKARDIVEGVATGGIAGAWNKNIGNWEGGLFNKLTGRPSADQLRQQQQQIADQVKAYQDQTELTKQQLDATRAATDVEKKRVESKQIRALRNNYRSPITGGGGGGGMLGQGQTPAPGITDNLGG
jgi:hypothetical protein